MPWKRFKLLGAEQGLGHHWGTFKLTDEGIERPAEALTAALPPRRTSRQSGSWLCGPVRSGRPERRRAGCRRFRHDACIILYAAWISGAWIAAARLNGVCRSMRCSRFQPRDTMDPIKPTRRSLMAGGAALAAFGAAGRAGAQGAAPGSLTYGISMTDLPLTTGQPDRARADTNSPA